MTPPSIHLFGAATPTGQALRDLLYAASNVAPVYCYSRQSRSGFSDFYPADLLDPGSFRPAGHLSETSVWISFAPIWHLASFLKILVSTRPETLHGLRGLVACSSSSVITKRYASNAFDRTLVHHLSQAENALISISNELGVTCRILRPTLIYGKIGPYVDSNIAKLIGFMRRLPFLPLPSYTGLRQPIHASQLASVALKLYRDIASCSAYPWPSECIDIGGDSQLSYESMLISLQQSLPLSDPARRCHLLKIPTALFQVLSSPLLLYSPKAFEAVMRMSSDLAGFTPSHQLLHEQPRPFPLEPLP